MRKHYKWLGIALFIFGFMAVASSTRAQVQEVTVFPFKDNTLFQSQTGSLSSGAGIHFFVGRTRLAALRRGVIAFNLAEAVPPGATIDSVRLSVTVSRSVDASAREVFLHQLSADWGEGASNAGNSRGGDGAPAQAGDATWIHRFSPGQTWSSAGGDFDGLASASTMVGGNATYGWGGKGSDPIVQDVQGWLDNPASNFGWILIGEESVNKTARQFNSRENATGTPQLTIRFFPLPTGVSDESAETPKNFRLDQNYPNPFNPATRIRFSLPEAAFVTLTVHNVLGEEVATLISREYPAGAFSTIWDGSGFPSGAYFYRMTAGDASPGLGQGFVQTRMMQLIK
jgi:hypothetical protein